MENHSDKIMQLAQIIRDSNNIVFFGGAGVSTESGIPDFRSADGVFNTTAGRKFSPEELVSRPCFDRYPEEFFSFYREKLIYPDAKPNYAHKFLARLEKEGKLKSVITQNIDGLHQSAGSKEVRELHGSVLRNNCVKCHKPFSLDYILKSMSIVPKCDSCGGTVKPDVVLYGEPLNEFTISQAVNDISNADTLIIGGTSLVVYPAAGFISYFRGKNLVLINKSETSYDRDANLCINQAIGEVFKEVAEILGWQ